jgi:hypothetical protein
MGARMKKRFSEEQIAFALRQAEGLRRTDPLQHAGPGPKRRLLCLGGRGIITVSCVSKKPRAVQIKQLPKRSEEYLFEIVMRRYETRSTMMTSSRPLEDWGKLIGDVPSATAILDRFLHHAEIITITGRSYRLKDHAATDPSAKPRPEKPTAGKETCHEQQK